MFQAPGHGNFGGVENLQTNEIVKLQDAEPPYLTTFRTKLRRKRLIPSDFVRILTICIALQLKHCLRILVFSKVNLGAEFNMYFEANSIQLDDDAAHDQQVGEVIFYHHHFSFLNEGWEKRANKVREGHVYFDPAQLAWHFERSLDGTKCGLFVFPFDCYFAS
jgi:hypothetical protein